MKEILVGFLTVVSTLFTSIATLVCFSLLPEMRGLEAVAYFVGGSLSAVTTVLLLFFIGTAIEMTDEKWHEYETTKT